MKYVYVLTSSENDIYYEQFLLSLASMRLYNPDAEVITLIDEKTKQGLTGKRSGYEKLVSRIIILKAPGELSQKETSRWIKTSVRNHLSGDFIFIDCDTIITDSIVCNIPDEIKIGAVLDTHVSLSLHHQKNEFLRQITASRFNDNIQPVDYFNSGVVFCRDAPETAEFYDCWNKLWVKSSMHGVSADQPSFNYTNYEFSGIIHKLSGEWNCQTSHNGLPFLHNAKIIHYYATSLNSVDPAFKLSSPPVFASIKETGELSSEIMKLLENPKSAFEPLSRIVSDSTVIEALDSSFLFKLIRFNKRHPWLSKRWNSFSGFLIRFVKRLSGK